MTTKLKIKITAANPDLDDQLYSLEELHAMMGLPFVAVKAKLSNGGVNILPIGTAICVHKIYEGQFVYGPTDCVAPPTTAEKYWKKFKDDKLEEL